MKAVRAEVQGHQQRDKTTGVGRASHSTATATTRAVQDEKLPPIPSNRRRGAGKHDKCDALEDSTEGDDAMRVTTSTLATTAVVNPNGNAKKLRLLLSREEKQRSALLEEARLDWESLQNQESWSRAAIAAFLRCRRQQEKHAGRQRDAEAIWIGYVTEEALKRTADEEQNARALLEKRQDEQRRTLLLLRNVDGQPAWARHRVSELMDAERTRRSFLYREEVNEAFELGIPNYEPVYVVLTRDERGTSCTTLEKVDYLKNECCPFANAEDCPYLSPSLRFQLQRTGLTGRTRVQGSCERGSSSNRDNQCSRYGSRPATGRAQDHRSGVMSASSQRVKPYPQREATVAAKSSAQLSLRASMKKGHYVHSTSAALAVSPHR